MRAMNWTACLFACLLSATAAAPAPATPSACRLGAADQAWIDRALDNWRYAELHLLHLPPTAMPEVVTFDARCVATTIPHAGSALRWTGAPHHGTVSLPDGNRIPAGVVSFAGPDARVAGGGFFVMSAPSVWRAGGVTSELGLETLMDGVLLHEMMHTRQFYFANPMMADLTRRYGLSDDINDDSLQDAFKGDAEYVRAYQAEDDLLYAAAAAPTDAQARVLARQALAAMRARRARWFTGKDAQWAPLDDIFLQMEGLGQWLIYKWYVDGPRRTYAPAIAQRAVRRTHKRWSQDEGLGLMLAVDRLVPDWRRRAFAPQPALAEALLAAAG